MDAIRENPDRLTAHPIREHGRNLERVRFQSAYSRRQVTVANEATKRPQRQAVIDHFRKHHPAAPMSLLSFPGVYWPFERDLQDSFPHPVRFTALDWNWGVIELGAPFMPGTCRPQYFNRGIACGSFCGFQTDSAKWIYSHAGSFLGLIRRNVGDRRDWNLFNRTYRRNTAVWLDLNTTLGGTESASCLENVSRFCDYSLETIPFALTIVMGQEWNAHEFDGSQDTSIGRRLPLIQKLIESKGIHALEVTDAWGYQSETGAHMGHVQGLLRATGLATTKPHPARPAKRSVR